MHINFLQIGCLFYLDKWGQFPCFFFFSFILGRCLVSSTAQEKPFWALLSPPGSRSLPGNLRRLRAAWNLSPEGRWAPGGRASPSTGRLQLLSVKLWVSLEGAQRGSGRTFVFMISVFPVALNKKDGSICAAVCQSRTPAELGWRPSIWRNLPQGFCVPAPEKPCRSWWDGEHEVIVLDLSAWQEELPSADC